ncbi:MAG: PQQ-like beta-propeller repeat protein, partial [Bacteroidetes bacterium]|nr:PQQ-like beta-propeller repeat protein [Bacteroidota bacterium]
MMAARPRPDDSSVIRVFFGYQVSGTGYLSSHNRQVADFFYLHGVPTKEKEMRTILSVISVAFLMTLSPCDGQQADASRQWPMYRGQFASGVLDGASLPDSFDVASGSNVRWSVEIPGLGQSSPAIWGDVLYITTAISKADNTGLKPGVFGDIASVDDTSVHEWKVYCIDKKSGRIIWERLAHTGVPTMKRHAKSSHASCSAATDGDHVVTFFGSEGLYCYSSDGELLWKKDFGRLESVFFSTRSAEWEFASSPIIYKGVVIVQVDIMNGSFVAAFDVKSGRELWKKSRDEWPGWSTPNIYTHNGRDIVVLNGYKHRGAYDFKTGEEIWKMAGGGDLPIPTPVIGKDLIYFNSAHGRVSPVYAVSKAATGDITLGDGQTSNQHVKWAL